MLGALNFINLHLFLPHQCTGYHGVHLAIKFHAQLDIDDQSHYYNNLPDTAGDSTRTSRLVNLNSKSHYQPLSKTPYSDVLESKKG